MTQREWNTLLDAEPHNLEARRMYAVWLQDEQDDLERAEFQRWLVEQKKWPCNPKPPEGEGWSWYWSTREDRQADHNVISTELRDLMPYVHWRWPTREEAEETLFIAWLKLKESKLAPT
jgi:hypothetical protein